MIREARILFLVALTYCIYATGEFFESGGIVFPFPLNEAVLFVVSITYAYRNKIHLISAVNVVAIGVFGLLMNLIYWEMIIPHERMVSFAESLWTDFFGILFGLSVLIFAIRTTVKQNHWINHLLTLGFISLFTIALIYNASLFFLLAYLLMTISTQLKPAFPQLHFLWGILLILEIAEFATFTLNSSSV